MLLGVYCALQSLKDFPLSMAVGLSRRAEFLLWQVPKRGLEFEFRVQVLCLHQQDTWAPAGSSILLLTLSLELNI